MKNSLVRRNPFDVFRDEEDWFERPFSTFVPFRWELDDFEAPKTDLVEKDDHYELKMDIPGFKKEEVNIAIDDGVITISANHEENNDKEEKGKKVLYERRSSSMSRSFRFPGLKKEDVKAALNDGVLELTIQKPKEEAKETQKIEIE